MLMKQDKFYSIVDQMSSSMKMKLDYLKRYLGEGKASAFVGAGFSRNAKMPETAEMKDWNMLGVDFFQRLYGHEPSSNDSLFLSPIHLASEVEASFGRNELDNLILRSLPDDVVVPSKLHKKLLDLNWHDVFTTNYDTLLERACLDTERPYTIVTNKETLLYSTSPRIVKLHGSFPNIRPFIITEEDYRTYPDHYPEFVNTVRQSLIENLFCLIGFSGDDPNFKSWYGWLRDVMGQQIAPVYLITYNPDLHDAKKKLFSKQKIDILNLADLPGVGNVQEGYDFLLQYVANDESKTQWNGHISPSLMEIKTKEQVIELIQQMAQVRRSYPGWIVLPQKYYVNFNDVAYDIVGFDNGITADLDIVDRICFFYELCWRQRISNTPIGVDWYVNALAIIPYVSDSYQGETLQMVMELKLALLGHYRKHGQREEFKAVETEIDNNSTILKEPQARLFYYERCLFAASCLDYARLGTLLSQWEVSQTDYVGVLWKASMMVELNRNNDAVNMLNSALRQLNISILANRGQTDFPKTCQSAMTQALWLYSRGRINIPSRNQSIVYETMRFFKSKLQGHNSDERKVRTHKFNVGQTNYTWSFGRTGFIDDYLYGYRYYSLRESCGMLFGMLSMTFDKDDQIVFLKHLIPYNYQYAFSIILRSCNGGFVKECVTRKALKELSRKEIDVFIDEYLDVANSLKNQLEEPIKERIVKVLLPLLSRLSTKASDEKVMALLDVQYIVYLQFGRFLVRDDVETLYNNLPFEKRIDAQRKSLELPLVLDGYRNFDFPQIDDFKNRLKVTHEMVSRVVEGLSHHDPDIQRNAYLRLGIIAGRVFDEKDKTALKSAISVWRSMTKDGTLMRDSYVSFPFDSTIDECIACGLLNEDMEGLSKLVITNIHSSEVFDAFCDLITHFHILSKWMTSHQHQLVVQKYIEFVLGNEGMLSKDDSEELLGGFRGSMTMLIRRMEGYLYGVDLSLFPIQTVFRLTDVAEKLSQWGYRHMAMQVLLCKYDPRLKESSIKSEIDEKISVDDCHGDAYQALVFLSKRNNKFQHIIQGIIRFCMYSTSQIVFNWLDCLSFFVENDVMTKETRSQLLKMLLYIYENLTDDAGADVFNDITVNTGRLAGTIAKHWGDTPETDKWKNLTLTGHGYFNEARYAFENAYNE